MNVRGCHSDTANFEQITQQLLTSLKSTVKTLEQGVKYGQS